MDFVEKIDAFRTGSVNFNGVTFARRVSKYVPDGQVFVIRQNEWQIWVVSGRELTDEEFFSTSNNTKGARLILSETPHK
jgi:hypothetical protein